MDKDEEEDEKKMIQKIEEKIKKKQAEREKLNKNKPKKKTKQQIKNDKERARNCLKYYVTKLINHPLYIVFMTIVTIYALFFDDIRLLALPKEKDDITFGFTLGSMIMFFVEIVMTTYAQPKYLNSFFFWLDLISTLSMIPDCGWIWNAMIDTSSGDSGGGSDAADLAKNSRAGRITRVIRIIRLIRLIRIVKLYKQQ